MKMKKQKKQSQKLPTGKVYVQQNGTQFYATIPAFIVTNLSLSHHSIIEYLIRDNAVEIKKVDDKLESNKDH